MGRMFALPLYVVGSANYDAYLTCNSTSMLRWTCFLLVRVNVLNTHVHWDIVAAVIKNKNFYIIYAVVYCSIYV